LPGGLAAYVTDAGGSAVTTEATYGEVTFTTVDDRKYLVEVDTSVAINTSASTFRVKITNSANTELQGRNVQFDGPTGAFPVVVRYLATGDGTSKTFKCRIGRTAGSGSADIGEVLLTVTDVGPSF
jgi:archaellum component FlaF (FlaF/FlaG flagellin family)